MTFACNPISSPTPPLAATNNNSLYHSFSLYSSELMQLYFRLLLRLLCHLLARINSLAAAIRVSFFAVVHIAITSHNFDRRTPRSSLNRLANSTRPDHFSIGNSSASSTFLPSAVIIAPFLDTLIKCCSRKKSIIVRVSRSEKPDISPSKRLPMVQPSSQTSAFGIFPA